MECNRSNPVLRLSATLAALACAATFATHVSAATVVLDFEDIPTSPPPIALMPAGYGGINWGNDFAVYSFPQPEYLAKSGVNRVSPVGFGPTVAFSFAGDVVFDGLWFSGPGVFGSVSLRLFNDNVLVGTSAPAVLQPTPFFMSGAFAGPVDRVEIVGPVGFYIFDDVTFTTGVATVPVPGALLLMLSGIVGFGALVRRKSASA